ncbi:MAG: cysteine desulfurase [Atopobiaceae bacterium]|nr:cysteine desulfurase [Atopobiaceae bacterium]
MEAMEPYWTERFYNPSAPYRAAREAHKDLEAARARLAHVLGSRAGNVTLTAGATEANNLALAAVDGLAIVCATEHESVLACAEAHGSRVVGVSSDATLKLDELRSMLDDGVELVSIGLANGEVGTIEPIREVARIVQDERMRRLEAGIDAPLLLHTDASQAAGHVSVNVSSLGVDLMTLSAAKVYGPKQVGLLWHGDGIALRPLVRGGGQEGGVRSGTENVAGAVGFACALELAERMRPAEGKRLRSLARRFRSRLAQDIPDVVFAGPARDAKRLPGIVHASFAGVEARRLVIALERRGVYVGTGSACAASRMRTSHVLRAMGYPDELAQGSLRISMGRTTTEDEVDYAARTIVECVGAERARMGWRRPSPGASSAVVVGAVQTHASTTVAPVSVAGAGREHTRAGRKR